MNTQFSFLVKIFGLVGLASLSFVHLAHADGVVRYVSIKGNNANNCLIATPCRTLQRGINQTPSGGELRILDSGNYASAATISRSITISGAVRDIALSRIALTINGANAAVALRNLEFVGAGAVQDGILVSAVSSLSIENCVVQGSSRYAVNIAGASGGIHVSDSALRNNGSGGLAVTLSGSTEINVIRTRLIDNGTFGASISGSIYASFSNTIAAGHTSYGISAAGGSTVMLDEVILRNNVVGLDVASTSQARISRSTVSHNVTGINNDGTVDTLKNNLVSGNNSADYSGAGTLNNITAF